ncbi:MAG: hypothetical protein ACE5RN_08015, partial [Nitrosopumilaceae archaeon]
PQPDDLPVDTTLICHIPPGNPDNAHTLMISSNAYPAHLAHGDYLGACIENSIENVEFEVPTDNETLNDALEILQILSKNLDDDSNVSHSISQAADLHKLFADEDKTTKKLFQSAFTQFNKDVKAYYGENPGFAEKSILNDLGKSALKIQMQIDKAEKDEQVKNKIQATKQFLNAQEELQNIKNQIFWEKQKYDKADAEKLEVLKLHELDLLKKTLHFTAKVKGEKVSPEMIKSIKKTAENEVEKNHKKNDINKKLNDDDKSNKGKENKGKSNSGKDNNGKGNSGKGNSGKGKNK